MYIRGFLILLNQYVITYKYDNIQPISYSSNNNKIN